MHRLETSDDRSPAHRTVLRWVPLGVACGVLLVIPFLIFARPSSGQDWLVLLAVSFAVCVSTVALAVLIEKEVVFHTNLGKLALVCAWVAVSEFFLWKADPDWMLVFFLSLTLFAVVAYTNFWEHWRFTRRPTETSVPLIFGRLLMALVMLVLFFATVTATLVDDDLVATSNEIGTNAIFKLQNYYAWHFFDAIPALKFRRPSTGRNRVMRRADGLRAYCCCSSRSP